MTTNRVEEHDQLLADASFLGERLAGVWVRPAPQVTDLGRRRFDRWRVRLGGVDPADVLPDVAAATVLRAFSGAVLVHPPTDEAWAALLVRHLADPCPSGQGDAGAPREQPYRRLLSSLVDRSWARLRSGQVARAVSSCPEQLLGACEQAAVLRLSESLGTALHQSFEQYRGARRHPLDVAVAAARDPVPDELHRAFLASCGPGGTSLWRRRPVLARLAAQLACDEAAHVERVLATLVADRSDVHRFLGRDPGQLVDLETGLGDRHESGRTVSRLRFADGTQLIHRPRSHDGLDVLRDVMAGLTGVALPPLPRQLSRGEHCWVQFISNDPIGNLTAYHEAAGGLVAVLRAVGAADIHRENVIRTSTGPAVIDAEVVAHPVSPAERQFADDLADRVLPGADMLDSVLHTGLLPTWDCMESGTVMDAGHLSPQLPSAAWVTAYRVFDRPGTDAERLVAPAGAEAHRPDLPTPGYRPHHWSHAVTEGYRRTAAQLAGRSDRPVAELDGVRIRFIARPTRIYGEVLGRALRRPELNEGVDLDIELEVLRAASAAAPAVVAAEQQDLRRLDIPCFGYEPTTGAFRHAGRLIDGFTVADEGPPLPVLPPGDVDRQVSVIRASMHALDGAPTLSASTCSELAHALLLDLLDRRVRARSGVDSWLSSELRNGSTRFVRAPVGWSLYDGQPGIALALAAGAVGLGSDTLADAAHAAVAPVLARILQDPDSLIEQVGIGYLGGAAGIGWAVRRFAELLDDRGARRAADLLEQRLVTALLGEEHFSFDELDLTTGVVGSIMLLTDDGGARAAEVDEGRHTAVRHLTRAVLAQTAPGSVLPGGLAHGWAGIALALDRAERLLASDEELAFEAGTRAIEAGKFADDQTEGLTWCAGRAGWGMVCDRPAVGPAVLVDQVPDEAPHHLCCGLVGSAVATLAALPRRERDDCAMHGRPVGAAALATSVLERLRREAVPRYAKALPAGLHQPGLMQGAAGLALGLLLIDGHPVPNPLGVGGRTQHHRAPGGAGCVAAGGTLSTVDV